MKKEKLRSEVEEKYKWDLSQMYANEKEFEKEIEELKKEIPNIKKMEGHILDSSSNLLKTLDIFYELELKVEKIYVYAYCNFSVDIDDKEGQKLFSDAKNVYNDFSSSTAFLYPEILESNIETIDKMIEENINLKKYKIILKRLFRSQKHILPKDKEKLFSDLNDSISNFQTCSTYLMDQVMEFENIHDEEENEVELTSTNYYTYITSVNREVRKEAYEKYHKVYKNFNSALASNYIGHIKYTELEAKQRNYKNVLEQDLDDMNLPKSVFDSLVEATRSHLDVYQKEYKLIKDVLKVDKLENYDISAPLLDEETEYSFEEAKKMIIEASKIYSEEYSEKVKNLFDNRKIDVYSNKNKKGGWYQNGSYLTHPVVFANYYSKYYDVSSLAHEIGHAVNEVYAVKNNPYHLYATPLFLAEVASLTNEFLLAKYLINKIDDKKQKLEILNTIIGVFSSNFFNGVKGAEFELQAHKLVEENKPITADNLNQIWKNLTQEYTGGIVEPNMYVWSKITHFFIDFYYYKYATGAAIAMYLSDKILNGENKEKYIDFLKLGNSLDVVDALKVAGVDITDKKVYEEAIMGYDKLLDEYMKIYNSL